MSYLSSPRHIFHYQPDYRKYHNYLNPYFFPEIVLSAYCGTFLAYYIYMNNVILSIPEHKGRVSPLFDVAGRFVIVNPESPETRLYIEAGPYSDLSKIERLKDSGVKIVICSAISESYAKMLLCRGIEIVPGVIGSIDDIIRAFFNDGLNMDQFAMPGCKWRGRNRGRRCPYYSEIFNNDIKRRDTK